MGRRGWNREEQETEDRLEGCLTSPLGEVTRTAIVMAVGISKKAKIQKISWRKNPQTMVMTWIQWAKDKKK